jgi:hypothetical protein
LDIETVSRRLRIALNEAAEQLPHGTRTPVPARRATRPARRGRWLAALVIIGVVSSLAIVFALSQPEDRTSVSTSPATPREVPASRLPSKAADLEVYLQDRAVDDQISAIRTIVESHPDVRTFAYVDQDAAFEKFKEVFADDPDLVGNIRANSLPTSFRLVLRAGVPIARVEESFTGQPGVGEVQRIPKVEIRTVVFDAQGDTIVLPRHWQRADTALAPELADPSEILAIGTFPLDVTDHDAVCVGNAPPASALEAMTSNDGFVWMVEWYGAASTDRPRPTHFAARQFDPRKCVNDAYPHLTSRSITFKEHERVLNIFIVAGADISAKRERQLYKTLDSLQFSD